mmetsp:Transcript_898/g.2018  ORF Transcript_898/g.2018 Transcript_898/m.2018 type:complete len:345 (-) Transcript_898:101-1135(-)
MVDYSKWNSLDDSDEEDAGPKKPRVQAFKGPQKITIGPETGGDLHVRPSEADSQPTGFQANVEDEMDDDEPMEPPSDDDEMQGEDCREDVLQLRALAERALRAGDAPEAVRLLEKAMRFGGASCPGTEDLLASAQRQALSSPPSVSSSGPRGAPAATVGGGGAGGGGAADAAGKISEKKAAGGGVVEGRYSWSQTRDSVEVNIFIPDGVKAKAVNRVDVSETSVRIDVDGAPVFQGDWEFKIEPEEDPDWEVRQMGSQRVIRLTVKKKPMPGGLTVIVWWRRVLKGDPGIDVGEIEERKKERVDQFSKAWADAHAAFREKAASRKPIEIDLSQPGGGLESMDVA